MGRLREPSRRGHEGDAEERWQASLAKQDDPRGQYALAIMYDMGEGVPQNSEQAFEFYRLAAEQGYADAQNNLGVMYDQGEGVSVNYKEAMKWYLLAAEQGNKDATANS